MKTPYLILTLAQQGGIGYPPVIVRLDGRWYAISDSRETRPDLGTLSSLFEYQRSSDRYWHSQKFVMRRWQDAPRLAWAEVIARIQERNMNNGQADS